MLLSRMPSGEPEIFATVQGEGTSIGVPSLFIRLAECNLKCTWCFVPETPVLMGDWSWRRLGDLAVGDEVIALTRPTGRYRHHQLAKATVTRTARRLSATVVVNDEVRCTADHRFWLTGKGEDNRSVVHSGWREIDRALGCRALFTAEPSHLGQRHYERGWLAGMADGDGTFWTLKFRRGYRRFRLALTDPELLDRAEAFAERAGFPLRRGEHKHVGFRGPGTIPCLWLTADAEARAFEAWVDEDVVNESWSAGYLGGILDAEGSLSAGLLRVAQDREANPDTYARIGRVLDHLGFNYTLEAKGYYVRRSAGQVWQVLSLTRPAKRSLLEDIEHHPHASRIIRTVESTGLIEEVVTLSTSGGSFVAGGYVVKNCDTAYTWDWDKHDRIAQTMELEVEDVVNRALALAGSGVRNVVFTGGEPLLQQAELAVVAQRLRDEGFRVEVETNGTVLPGEAASKSVDQWNVSPKLENSGNPLRARRRGAILDWFAAHESAAFKFVVTSPADIDEVAEIAEVLGVAPGRVILMPEGTDARTVTERSKWLAGECRDRGYRLSTRLHVLLWGTDRGR